MRGGPFLGEFAVKKQSASLRWSRTTACALGVVLLGCSGEALDAQNSAASAEERSGTGTITGATLPTQWPNHGSDDCTNHTNSDPSIYVFKYDADTFILRENKCLNFEANFVYLLFGHDKVLMQDTGSIPQGFSQSQFKQAFPLRDTVERNGKACLN